MYSIVDNRRRLIDESRESQYWRRSPSDHYHRQYRPYLRFASRAYSGLKRAVPLAYSLRAAYRSRSKKAKWRIEGNDTVARSMETVPEVVEVSGNGDDGPEVIVVGTRKRRRRVLYLE